MKTKKAYIYNLICLLAIALTLLFIFSRSLPNKESSKAESESVLALIKPFLELFVGKGNATNHLVRKLAHFAEFGLLGTELALLFRRFTLTPFFISLVAALTDETIQLFTERGSMVQDVWLDFSGAATGLVLMTALWLLLTKVKASKSAEKST